ncbi:MAG: hypothetical protein K2X66_13415, partial [Cyanobacteria bacterium]|nr:hypothetical protein [Cyanobacteriota bacterium]
IQDVFEALGLNFYPPGYDGPRLMVAEPAITIEYINDRLSNPELSDSNRLILKILLTRFEDIENLASKKRIVSGDVLQKIAFRNGDGKTFDSEDLKPDIPIIIDPPLDTPTVFKFETQQVLDVFNKAVSSQYPDGWPTNNFAAPTLSKETLLKFLNQLPTNSDEATIVKILISNYDLMTFIPRGVAPMPGEILPTKPFNAALIKEVAGADGSDSSFSSDDLDALRNRPPVP